MDQERETKPGFVLKAYERAKAKIAALKDRGEAKAGALLAGAAPAAEDPVTAGKDWKDAKAPTETSDAARDRSQQEMDETFGAGPEGRDAPEVRTDLPDGSDTAVMQGGPGGAAADREEDESRGPAAVELAAADTAASIGAEDNPAAMAAKRLDQEALMRLAEAEDGQVPTDGLGLDDGPGVRYPGEERL